MTVTQNGDSDRCLGRRLRPLPVGRRRNKYAVPGTQELSSHGIIGLTQTAATEYAQQGIRINAVCPGIVRTPMIERLIAGDPKREARLTAASPCGRMASPEEVANAVVWLCSDAASYVTGHAPTVDGGRRRRYRCKSCGGTFVSSFGTPYHRLKCTRAHFDKVAALYVFHQRAWRGHNPQLGLSPATQL